MIFTRKTIGFLFTMLVFSLSAVAATNYVTPTGANAMNGVDWDNAYSATQLQAAVDASSGAGDLICLRYGVYSNSAEISAVNRPGLTIRGGYEGVGSPGGFTNDLTILTRDPSVTNRIFSGQASTLTFERLSITNGLLSSTNADVYGAGLFLTNCITLVTNCVIEGNSLPSVIRPALKNHYGSGICAITGSLTVVNSRIRNNGHAGYVYNFSNMGSRFGDGIYAKSATVTLTDVLFDYNSSGIRDGLYGCALSLYGGNAVISGCNFNTNAFITYGWTGNGAAIYADLVKPLTISNCNFSSNTISGAGMSYGQGGAIFISACFPFAIANCVFQGQEVRSISGASRGNVMYLAGAGLAGTIDDCSITDSNNLPGSGFIPLEKLYIDVATTKRVAIRNTSILGGPVCGGIFKMGTGSLAMTNCLVAATGGHGLQITAGTSTVANCTMANNFGWGVSNASGTVTARNCIAWGNTNGGFTTNCILTYTCSQEAHAGDGNKNVDPLFDGAATNNFRLRRASPCVNTGLNEDWMIGARDLDGNARIINKQVDMGAYEMTSPWTSGAMIVVR